MRDFDMKIQEATKGFEDMIVGYQNFPGETVLLLSNEFSHHISIKNLYYSAIIETKKHNRVTNSTKVDIVNLVMYLRDLLNKERHARQR